MKRGLLLVTLAGLLALAAACGGGEKEVTIPGTDGKVKVTTGGELPEDFPDDFPIFKDAELTGTLQGEEGGQSGFFATWETDASVEEVTDFYKEELDKDPWQSAGVFSSTEGTVISFTRADNVDFGGGVTIAENDGTQIVVFLGEGAGLGAEGGAEGEEEAPPGEAQPPAEAELPEEVELPDDYPTDIVPIPDDARVTNASSISSGGESSFVVTYLTKDDAESVGDFYEAEGPGDGWSQTGRFSSGGAITISYQNEAEGGSLIVGIQESSSYEGYTEVSIVLTTGQ